MKFKRLVFMLIFALLAGTVLPLAGALAEESLPYRVDVDIVNQIVTVYENRDNGAIVMQCLCSSGADDATPLGTFKMPKKKRDTERTEWFHFRAFGGYARYATRIHQDVMFHSLLYSRPKESAINQQSVRDYGYPVSHGCIRLRTEDAKFIAEGCPVGTRVKIHKDNERDEELRDLLFQSSYYASSGQSYSQFQGVPDEPGILGKGSSGSDVRDLMLKLQALGIYDGEIGENYTLATVRAVREAQALLGMEQTGMATLEFQEAITSPEAPSAMNVTLAHGASGPAVRALQRNLQALQLYEGDIDGVFDVDVTEGVTTFQTAYGFPADGVAPPIVQKAIYYEAGYLRALAAGGIDCRLEPETRELYMGTVNCEVGIKLRREPSTESESLMSLRNGTSVIGMEYGEDWSRVMKNGVTGYVRNTYMQYSPTETLVLNYVDVSGEAVYVIGITSLNESPAEEFTAYVEGGGSLDKHADLTERAVGAGEITVLSAPVDGADALVSVPAGAEMKVLLKSSEWSLVEYGDVQGYVRNDDVDFHLGPSAEGVANDPGSAEYYEDDTTELAVTSPHEGDAVPVYESGDESSAVLGSLKAGVEVNVIETVDGWSLIELDGHQGYAKEIDLKFTART